MFDIEAAPYVLSTSTVQKHFDDIVEDMNKSVEELDNSIAGKKKRVDNQSTKGNNTDKADKDIEKEEKKLEKLKAEYALSLSDAKMAKEALNKYYEEDLLKAIYFERTDKTLTDLFTTGILSQWKSEDVLLRKTEKIKILDHFRQTVKWD